MTSSDTPPPFDLLKSVFVVKYEYGMALATASLLSDSGGVHSEVEIAVLESFLVHARNLHEFLAPRDESSRRLAGDIWACEIVDSFGFTVFDGETIQGINRRLQHVTRWRYEEHIGWDAREMLKRVHAGMDAFLQELNTESRAPLARLHSAVGQALRLS